MVFLGTYFNTTEALNLEISAIFNEFFKYGIMYVYILHQSVNNPMKMQTATWFPYSSKACADKVENIRLIDECEYIIDNDGNNGKIGRHLTKSYNYDIFPKIPNNLHNCSVYISAVINEPYVHEATKTTKRGSEYEMLLEITKYLNMNPIFKIINESVSLKKITDSKKSGLYMDLLLK